MSPNHTTLIDSLITVACAWCKTARPQNKKTASILYDAVFLVTSISTAPLLSQWIYSKIWTNSTNIEASLFNATFFMQSPAFIPLISASQIMPLCRCLQNYIPPQSLTLSCPVCRQTSILPEKGVAALQNNFFITNLMEVLQRDPECSRPDDCNVLESASAATACQPLSCPNHEGKVSEKQQSTGVLWCKCCVDV